MKNYNRKEINNFDSAYYYYLDDILHRTDGPAVEYANGTKDWYQNGNRHRIDGSAIEYANGDKIWYQNGNRHRTDGPAVEHIDGIKFWYYYGEFIDVSSQKEFEKYIKTLILL